MPNPNVGLFSAPAQAKAIDSATQKCLNYISCITSYAYYKPETGLDKSAALCYSVGGSDIEEMSGYTGINEVAWNMGDELKREITHGVVPENEIIAENAFYIYDYCMYLGLGTTDPASTEYIYTKDSFKDDKSKSIVFAASIETCPNGGLAYGAPNITSCYIYSFTEVSGSGVYTFKCSYTE